MNARKISFIAMLIALAAVGRIALGFIPNVQPTTTIIIIAAFLVNPFEAVIIAVLSTVLSNLYLGSGMWTIYQAAIWSIIGLMSGLLGKYHQKLPLYILILFAGLCGIIYGFLMSIIQAYVMDVNLWVYYLAGLPFDISHAIGNMVFFSIFYPVFFRLIKKKSPKSSSMGAYYFKR